MGRLTDEQVYANITPRQRAELDDMNASTARWQMVKKVAIGSIFALIVILFFAS